MNRRVLKTLVVVFWVVYALPCLAQEGDLQTIEALRKNPKLVEPELLLDDFVKGESWTQVKVSLAKPKGFRRRKFNKLGAETALLDAVKSAQEQVINRLDANVVVTYRFKYVFGFSAKVTLMGLEELTKMREVTAIRKPTKLKPHLEKKQKVK